MPSLLVNILAENFNPIPCLDPKIWERSAVSEINTSKPQEGQDKFNWQIFQINNITLVNLRNLLSLFLSNDALKFQHGKVGRGFQSAT